MSKFASFLFTVKKWLVVFFLHRNTFGIPKDELYRLYAAGIYAHTAYPFLCPSLPMRDIEKMYICRSRGRVKHRDSFFGRPRKTKLFFHPRMLRAKDAGDRCSIFLFPLPVFFSVRSGSAYILYLTFPARIKPCICA